MNVPTVLRDSTQIKGLYVRLNRYGTMECHFCIPHIYKKFFTYTPYFFGSHPDTILHTHDYRSIRNKNTKKLYVNPSARISRDLLRNSGYQLVRDKDSADAIVVPSFSDSWYYSTTLHRNMVVWSDTTKFSYLVEFHNESKASIDDNVIKSLQERICEFLGQTEDELTFYRRDNSLNRFEVYLIPPVDDYFDILDNTYGDRYNCSKTYITDSYIPTTSLYTMDIETLEMASRMDIEFLEKFIISCPWKEYPFTLHTFLRAERKYEADQCKNKNAKMVLEYINFADDYKKAISAKDLDMIQSWIFHKIGIDEKKSAFVPIESVTALHPEYQRILRMKYAVSRISIADDKEITYDSLKEYAQI